MFLAPLLILGLQQGTPPPLATDPWGDGILARWQGGQATEAQVDRFLGRNLRGKSIGQEALIHLLQIDVVQIEAERRKLKANETEVQRQMAVAERSAEEEGFDFDATLARRGMNRTDLLELLRTASLHAALVRQDLKLAADAIPSAEQQAAWTQQRVEALLAEANAHPGLVLDVPPYRITVQELGATIRIALHPKRLREHIQQWVLQQWLEKWGNAQGLVVDDAVRQAELDWRADRVAKNPVFAGATYEVLLSAQGSSVEAVRQSEELRAAAWLRLYSRQRFDDAWFAIQSQKRAKDMDAEFGETRQVAWLLLRATENPADPLDLSFAQAAEELRKYKDEAADSEAFLKLAGELSEDENSRRRKGLLGWIHATEPGVDPAVCATASKLQAGVISDPVRTAEGQALVLVLEIRPRPEEAAFRALVRRGQHQALREEILRGLKLEIRGW